MYVADQLIYLQLQKTASTHIASLLPNYLKGEQIGKHAPLTFDPGDRLVVGSIRNPWDWYVSLWSYGCQQKGAIYSELTSDRASSAWSHVRLMAKRPRLWPVLPKVLLRDFRKDRTRWTSFYEDSQNPDLFRRWLTRILTGRNLTYLEEGYPFFAMADFCGLMTFRFLRLFSDYPKRNRQLHRLRSRSDLEAFYTSASISKNFIRLETLEKDLSVVLNRVGCKVGPEDLFREKSNASKRRSFTYYYDSGTAALVRDKDGFVCDLFGYEYPH